jgi:hypothetical protein
MAFLRSTSPQVNPGPSALPGETAAPARGRLLRALPALALAALVGCSGGSSSGGETPTGSAQPYTPNATVTGNLATNPARGPNGGVGQLYTLTLTQQTNLQFTLTASGFPPFLGLYTGSGQAIVERANTDTSFKAFLPAGTFQVFVDSMNDASGTFTLTSAPTQTGGCLVAGGTQSPLDNYHTVKGATLAGTITTNNCGDSLAKIHNYELPLTAGAQITLAFTVDKMSGVAIRSSSGGTPLASREMPGAGSSTLSATVPTSGYYTVSIESRTAGGVSSLPVAYTVTIN